MTDKERRGLLGSAYIVLSIMTKIGKDDYELLTGHNLLEEMCGQFRHAHLIRVRAPPKKSDVNMA